MHPCAFASPTTSMKEGLMEGDGENDIDIVIDGVTEGEGVPEKEGDDVTVAVLVCALEGSIEAKRHKMA